eukprot:g20478.t1
MTCKVLCKQELTEEMRKKFKTMIKDEYLVNWIVDNLPAATKYARAGKNDRPGRRNGGTETPCVSTTDGRINLKHHSNIDKYVGFRIVGFEVEPFSMAQAVKEENGAVTASCQEGDAAPIFDLDAHDQLTFTYDVTWSPSEIRWASRFDNYLKMTGGRRPGQIHWFSILNSLMIMLFLSGMIAVIILRTIHRDITKYNELASAEEAAEETGWKLVHGDVFRKPRHSKLLAVSVGSGVQIVCMSVVTLFLALLGVLSPVHRGALLQSCLLLFTFMGFFAGYVSSRLYKTFNGADWKQMTLLTAFLYPGIFFAIFFILNLLIWGQRSSGAVPFTTMFAMLCLWFGVSVPLVCLGAYFGFRKANIELPVRTNQIPRQIPVQSWFMKCGSPESMAESSNDSLLSDVSAFPSLLEAMCKGPADHASTYDAQPRACVVLVDPCSTGAMLAPELDRRGYTVLALWTSDAGEHRGHLPQAAKGFPEKFLAELDEQPTLSSTAALLREACGGEPKALICGGETGVKLADALSEHMGLRGNTTAHGMANRRDKQVQQDAVKAQGLRAVRSVCGKRWDEVKDFTDSERFPIIVKPGESGGSDGVKLCATPVEAEQHFQLLMTRGVGVGTWEEGRRMNSQRKVGPQRAAVLLQEYLRGTEYIVDNVSRDGQVAQELIAYTRGCLDALRITDGATHTEVMMTETGPCLVEVDACVDAFLDADAFQRLPDVPREFLASGQVSMLVSYHDGHVESTHFEKVRDLESVVFLEENLHAGRRVEKTIDLFSLIGICVQVHRDPTVLADDVQAIREMEQNGSLFVLPGFTILVGGVLPFGAVFTELFFIMSSIWQHQFYYLFGFLALVLVILLITCAEIAMALTYFQLTAEDYNWWWRSFLSCASSGLYVFMYAILYFSSRLSAS